MSGALVSVPVLIGAIVILVGAASFLEGRAKAHGNLFSGHASTTSRVIAFLFALLFGGLSVYQANALGRVTVAFPILAVAFLAYGLGRNSLMHSIQGRGK